MDTHTLFTEFLAGWPDGWIAFEIKSKPAGHTKMRVFFKEDSTKALFDDLLDFIKEECIKDKSIHETLCASDWLGRYFHTVRYRQNKEEIGLAIHEPILMTTAAGVEPLKGLLDEFIEWVVNKEVKPCIS